MLGFIGLTDDEEAAYRALARLGSASGAEMARQLDVGADRAAALLRGLVARGMAATAPGDPRHFTPTPPPLAFGGALAERRHELERAEAAVAALTEDFRLGAARHAHAGLVEPLTGAAAIRHRFEQLGLGAKHELLALVTARPIAVSGDEHEVEEQTTARGVNYRVVIEQELLEQPSTVAELSAALDRTQQVRAVDRVPTKLVVADRSVALLPLLSPAEEEAASEPTAVVVHAGGLLQALVGLFEAVWSSARPLLLSADGTVEEVPLTGGPDDTDLLILSLMLTGLTDRAVAGRLELGLRTMQRRVQRLMELAGVTTRMQLGWHAYEQGWVKR